jgi:hypothetical protein
MTLIVEPEAAGHHMEYVEYLSRYLLQRDLTVTLLTSDAAIEDPGFGTFTSANDPRVSVEVRPRDASVFRAPMDLARLAQSLETKRVLAPSGDHLVLRIGAGFGWLDNVELRALLMRSPWFSPRVPARDVLKKALIRRASRRSGVHVLHLVGAHDDRGTRLHTVQDPSRWQKPNEVPEQLRSVELDDSRVWFGVLGLIDERKNIPLILSALEQREPQETGLVLAGRVDPRALHQAAAELTRFESLGGRVVVINRFLAEPELDYLVDAVHCVICAHSNEGPSGILLKAAAAGQRSIAAGARSLRREAEMLDACEWVPLRVAELGDAFERAVTRPRSHPLVRSSATRFAESFMGESGS